MTYGANYTAQRATVDGIEVVRLTDAARNTQVSVVPSIGNIAYEMVVRGKNILWTPFNSLAEFKAKPTLCGVPFLAPWANRLDRLSYFANGKQYVLNKDLGNLRFDQNQFPIHGLLAYSPLWRVTDMKADDRSARVTSSLEYWKYPELMAQFPFAHRIEMTYRLSEGTLEVATSLHNMGTEPMPVSIGFHPYFRLYDAPRDEWTVHLAARESVVTTEKLIPKGFKPIEYADPLALEGTQLDDGFVNLIRGADGRAEFWMQGKKEKISVLYGPKYTVAVGYAPPGRNFICFEPMTAITNGLNLAQEGLYKELQNVGAGAEWRESFWIKPSGF